MDSSEPWTFLAIYTTRGPLFILGVPHFPANWRGSARAPALNQPEVLQVAPGESTKNCLSSHKRGTALPRQSQNRTDQSPLTPYLWQGQEFQAPQCLRLSVTCKTGKRSITTTQFLTTAPTVLLWKLQLYLQVLNEKNFFLALHGTLKHLTSFSPEMLPSTTWFSSTPFYAAPEIQGTFCSDVLMAPEIYCWDHRHPHEHPIP